MTTRPNSSRELVEYVAKRPDLYEHVTIDSARSVPVLVDASEFGGPAIALFWFPAGGPVGSRLVYSPYFGVTVSYGRPDAFEWGSITPSTLGITQPSSEPLGPAQIGPFADMEEFRRVESALYDSLDVLAPKYLRDPTRLGDAERSAARTYLSSLDRLAQVTLRDAHRARSPKFFAWLDALAR